MTEMENSHSKIQTRVTKRYAVRVDRKGGNGQKTVSSTLREHVKGRAVSTRTLNLHPESNRGPSNWPIKHRRALALAKLGRQSSTVPRRRGQSTCCPACSRLHEYRTQERQRMTSIKNLTQKHVGERQQSSQDAVGVGLSNTSNTRSGSLPFANAQGRMSPLRSSFRLREAPLGRLSTPDTSTSS